ncbi:Uncharacterized conserved protein [Chitinophaga sp. YR627]|uniref:hypothetical protein n=1 Tax=Chitinophaga sp. YR627 TaxID=1881041 RepID=UPI0008EAE363|nr:hypothetical protein [Chitinophaga sp. YR627]SFO60856.1 Uncharacterized conserved protein [Chitinophaga sp. YR627]
MARLLLTYVLLITCFLLGGCFDDRWERGYIDAYVPVYSNNPTLRQISYLPARAFRTLGKLYTYDVYILQEEADSGLHIISYQDPAHPVKSAFLRIPGFKKALIEGDYLYADNYNDLVIIPLKELPSLTHVGRVPGAWSRKDFPPFRSAYFECPDPSKGTVIGWTLTKVDNPKCRTNYAYYDDFGEARPYPNAGIVANDKNLYFADNLDLVSYSIEQPLAPVFKTRYETGNFMDSLCVIGNKLIATNIKGGNGSWYDITDPTQVVFKNYLDAFGSCHLFLPTSNYIYAISNPLRRDCYPQTSILTAYAIEDGYDLKAMNSFPFDTTYALALSGTNLYAATNKGVSILDVSAPPALSRLVDKAAVPYTDVVIRGTELFCRGRATLDCYDISSPAAIKLISKLVY